MAHVSDAARRLERDLRDIFANRLQSLVVYGGPKANDGAAHAAHGHVTHEPLTHTLAIAETLTADDLRACAARVTSWHDAGLATPLLLRASEFERSLDAFPLEFGAILADHVLVSGRNPFEGLRLEDADVRRACEVQARSHLLHLREGYLETRGRSDAIAVLIVDSAPAFAALLRSIASLQGVSTGDSRSIARHAHHSMNMPPDIVEDVMKLAAITEISSAEAVRIFPAYLDAVERLVQFVDGWK